MTRISIDLDELITEELITASQKGAILNWQKQKSTGESSSRLIQILATFGSVVTGLGVILLIAANWDTISDMMQTILMIGATTMTYILGYYLSYTNTNYTKTGQALMLLGSLLYGASILLLGQIYNLGGTFASALLIWSIPVLLLAYATRFIALFFLSIGLIYTYIIAELGGSFVFSGFIIANIFIAIGYLSLVLLRYHRGIYRSFAPLLSWTGGASILSGLFAYTFMDFWQQQGVSWYASHHDAHTTMWILMAIIGIGVLIVIATMLHSRHLYPISDTSILLVCIPIGILFFYTSSESVTSYVSLGQYDTTILIPTIVMNIVYLASLALMIYMGVKRDNRSFINIAMIYLAIYLFSKYLGFVVDSKMDGAYVFIAGGLICIAMTILIEKIRKRILLSMN